MSLRVPEKKRGLKTTVQPLFNKDIPNSTEPCLQCVFMPRCVQLFEEGWPNKDLTQCLIDSQLLGVFDAGWHWKYNFT